MSDAVIGSNFQYVVVNGVVCWALGSSKSHAISTEVLGRVRFDTAAHGYDAARRALQAWANAHNQYAAAWVAEDESIASARRLTEAENLLSLAADALWGHSLTLLPQRGTWSPPTGWGDVRLGDIGDVLDRLDGAFPSLEVEGKHVQAMTHVRLCERPGEIMIVQDTYQIAPSGAKIHD